MDKNTLIGIALIVLIVIGYGIYTAPTEAQLAAEQKLADQKADSIAAQMVHANKRDTTAHTGDTLAVDKLSAVVQLPDSILRDSTLNLDSVRTAVVNQKKLDQYGIFSSATSGTAQTVLMENEDLELRFSTKGARPLWIRLKK